MDLFSLNPLGILLMFIAAIIYTIAAIVMPIAANGISDWTAILYAMPLVFLEYNCSVRGNRLMRADGLSTFEILNLTIVFYFIGLLLTNKIFVGDDVKLKDLAAIALVGGGFYVGFAN